MSKDCDEALANLYTYLDAELDEDCVIVPIKKDSPEGLEILRHSTSHVMAQAVRDIFPEGEAKIAIGPPIADGFYYDFDLPRALTPEDLAVIEKKMKNYATWIRM